MRHPIEDYWMFEGLRQRLYWDNKSPKIKATTHALNVLWVTGEVLVVRRDGMERHFDLPHKVVPAENLRRAEQTDPREGDRALLQKYIRAFRIFDLGDFRFGWQKIPARQRRPLIERYLEEGTVVPLEIDGVRRAYFALAEDIERIRRHERDGRASLSDGKIRFLAPLDNLLWRRARLVDLFDFLCLGDLRPGPQKALRLLHDAHPRRRPAYWAN